eukprot:5754516-Alexandrium_andersonii.AAC.1
MLLGQPGWHCAILETWTWQLVSAHRKRDLYEMPQAKPHTVPRAKDAGRATVQAASHAACVCACV